jgi:HEAT repeat protein
MNRVKLFSFFLFFFLFYCTAFLFASEQSDKISPAIYEDIIESLWSDDQVEVAHALQIISKSQPYPVAEILKKRFITETNQYIKKRAFHGLQAFDNDAILSVWLDLLHATASPAWKKHIIEELVESNSKKIVMPLVRELDSQYFEVRKAAIEALRKIGDDRVYPKIFRMAGRNNPVYRIYALEALYELYDFRMYPVILQLLKDSNKAVRIAALQCVQKNNLEKTTFLVRKIALHDLNWEVQKQAVAVLNRFHDRGCKYVLTSLISHEYKEVRLQAAKAFLNLKFYGIASYISRQLYREEDVTMQHFLLDILIYLKKSGGFKGLKRVIRQSDSPAIRIKAVYVLGLIRGSTARYLLIEALRDKDFRVRAEICNSLGYVRGNAAAQALLQIIKTEKKRYVRSAALFALERIGGRYILRSLKKVHAHEQDPVFKQLLYSLL